VWAAEVGLWLSGDVYGHNKRGQFPGFDPARRPPVRRRIGRPHGRGPSTSQLRPRRARDASRRSSLPTGSPGSDAQMTARSPHLEIPGHLIKGHGYVAEALAGLRRRPVFYASVTVAYALPA